MFVTKKQKITNHIKEQYVKTKFCCEKQVYNNYLNSIRFSMDRIK